MEINFHGTIMFTDPWLTGPAFARGWWLMHEPPADWLDRLEKADFIYISHLHSDHLRWDYDNVVNRVHLCFIILVGWVWGVILLWGGTDGSFEYHLIFVVNGESNRQGRETYQGPNYAWVQILKLKSQNKKENRFLSHLKKQKQKQKQNKTTTKTVLVKPEPEG